MFPDENAEQRKRIYFENKYDGVKGTSIFFNLPYFTPHMVALDLMHSTMEGVYSDFIQYILNKMSENERQKKIMY